MKIWFILLKLWMQVLQFWECRVFCNFLVCVWLDRLVSCIDQFCGRLLVFRCFFVGGGFGGVVGGCGWFGGRLVVGVWVWVGGWVVGGVVGRLLIGWLGWWVVVGEFFLMILGVMFFLLGCSFGILVGCILILGMVGDCGCGGVFIMIWCDLFLWVNSIGRKIIVRVISINVLMMCCFSFFFSKVMIYFFLFVLWVSYFRFLVMLQNDLNSRMILFVVVLVYCVFRVVVIFVWLFVGIWCRISVVFSFVVGCECGVGNGVMV